jgi:protein kinase C substrate 80K-H
VCDYDICCDGSDEWRVSCPSRCAEIGKAARKLKKERAAQRSEAASARRELVRKAEKLRGELRGELEKDIDAKRKKVADSKARVEALRRKLKETEERERARVVVDTDTPSPRSRVIATAKEKTEELRALLKKLRIQRDSAEVKLERAEAILRDLKEGYNPNFNDEGVKTAVRAWEEYLADGGDETRNAAEDRDLTAVIEEEVDWEEIAGPEEEGVSQRTCPHHHQSLGYIILILLYTAGLLTQFLPPAAQKWVSAAKADARELLISNGLLAPPKTDGTESAAVTAARDALAAAEKEEKDTAKDLANLEKSLATDFGPDDVFRALKGSCITRQFGEYDYELCFMEKATQKSRKDNGRQNLGNFAAIETRDEAEQELAAGVFAGSWEESLDEPLTGLVLKHDNGAQCWNGPKRSVAVELYCNAENEIRNVVEMEKCVYRMEVGTPAACEEEKKEIGKDEL